MKHKQSHDARIRAAFWEAFWAGAAAPVVVFRTPINYEYGSVKDAWLKVGTYLNQAIDEIEEEQQDQATNNTPDTR